jgi:hypothetical protein
MYGVRSRRKPWEWRLIFFMVILAIVAVACEPAPERPPHSIGPDSASVTVVEYGDFQ